MVHVDGGHGLWFREPEVDGDSAVAISIGREPAPIARRGGLRDYFKAPADGPKWQELSIIRLPLLWSAFGIIRRL
jgi:hypothetical protein